MSLLLIIAIAYLSGCLNASFYLAKWFAQVDIRQVGSGNAGSRNLSRSLGLRFAILAFLWDAAKAFLVVYGATCFAETFSIGPSASVVVSRSSLALFALCAVIAGHIWPVQLAGRGGKGLASLLGGLLALSPIFFGVCLIFFLCVYLLFSLIFQWRKPDAAVYVSVLFLPCLFFAEQVLFASRLINELFLPSLLFSIISAIVLVAHRKNILAIIMPFILAPIQDIARDETQN